MNKVKLLSILMALLLVRLCRAGDSTNFIDRLDPVPPFASLLVAANSNNIPVSGMSAPVGTNSLRVGDSVTAVITLHEKKSVTQWLFCCEVAASTNTPSRSNSPPTVLYTSTGNKFEFPNSPAAFRLRILGPFFEANSGGRQRAHKDESAGVSVNQTFLGLGLDRATMVLHRLAVLRHEKKGTVSLHFGIEDHAFPVSEIARGREMAAALQFTPEEERALAGGIPALFSYFETVDQTPDLESILIKVVSLPSVWSIVANFGVSPGFAIGKPDDRDGPISLANWDMPPGFPLYSLPVRITLNHHDALALALIVTAARPPFLACSGIVGFLAENPSDKDIYLTLRVISARRAAPTR
jgi:hypothetical protein